MAGDISCSEGSIDSSQVRSHDDTASMSLSPIVCTESIATRTLGNAPSGSAYGTESTNPDDDNQPWEGSSYAHMSKYERVFGLQKRAVSNTHTLFKRAGGNFREGLAHSGSKGKAACQMTNYCFKPYYPGPGEVKKYETKPKSRAS